jgi:ribosome-binding factor A
MTSRRVAKISQAVLEQISTSILFSLKDPRVKNVTVTHVEVSPDVRTAKVYVSIMGDEKEQALCLHGLNSAKGFLQKKIADRIQTRYTPVLTFINDQGVKKSIAASKLIREALEEDARRAAEAGVSPTAGTEESPPPLAEPPTPTEDS